MFSAPIEPASPSVNILRFIMIINFPNPLLRSKTSTYFRPSTEFRIVRDRKAYPIVRATTRTFKAVATGAVTAAIVLASAAVAIEAPRTDYDTLSDVPQTLSGECASAKDCKKPRIQRPKSRKAESCTIKCVTTCIRGGEGSPGEGPFNIRRPLVVFKQGFRSRTYCLVECSDICNLMGEDGDDWP